jgi:2-keto-4-pentenoate hydratase/2-oxohepta-3-ene-1,7-dioic acid hydratase in catechol pathway
MRRAGGDMTATLDAGPEIAPGVHPSAVIDATARIGEGAAIGPFVVTPDEVPEGAGGLKIESRVGDEILQSSNTGNMIWPAAKAISIISGYTTLQPGDHIALGTPPGVGHAKKPNPRWLKPGEVIDIEIEGIGICSNPIVDEADMAAKTAAE